MLGFQEKSNTESPKTYKCVACSTLFNNLSSLLVHQASHAVDSSDTTLPACSQFSTTDLLEKHEFKMFPMPAHSDVDGLPHVTERGIPTCSSCGSMFDSHDLLDKHQCVAFHSPSTSVPAYITEGGENCANLTAGDEHMREHNQDATDKSLFEGSSDVIDGDVPSCASCGNQFASNEEIKKHQCVALTLSTTSTASYLCDRGEDISDLTVLEDLIMEQCQEATGKFDFNGSPDLPERKIPICDGCGNVFASKNHLEKHECSVLPQDQPQPCDPNNISDVDSNRKQNDVENNGKAGFQSISQIKLDSISSTPVQIFHSPSKSSVNKNIFEQNCSSSSNMTLPSDSLPKIEEQEQNLEEDSETLKSSNEPNHLENENSPNQVNSDFMEQDSEGKSKSILKMLASAYTSQTPVPIKQRNLPPRKVSPRAPIQPLNIVIPSKLETQSNQSKLPSTRGKIISVTQTLCPVVALETRQKLYNLDSVEGRHQCRICRRVFQDVDSLIMHHALHRKERVKFCLFCQQFVIRLTSSATENHVCFDTNSRSQQLFSGNAINPPTAPPPGKMFYCSLCKRGYQQMRYLKRHKCPCRPRPKPLSKVPNSINTKLQNLEVRKKQMDHSNSRQMSIQHTTIAVGTERVKMEEQNSEFPIGKKNPLETTQPSSDAMSSVNAVKHPTNIVGLTVEENKKLVEKQWTMPLDDAEIELLADVEQNDMDVSDVAEVEPDDVIVVDSSEYAEMNSGASGKGYQVHVTNKGVKRYVCNECQKTYSRRFTLFEHLKVCEVIKVKEQTAENNLMKLQGPIKRFPCPQCGKYFSRKDNMKMHHKRCQLTNTNQAVSTRTAEPKQPQPQQNLFVLSPSTYQQPVRQESTQNTSSNRNWGIMSLPTVLPRRVTCECGTSFTCPRLLFEHLQQHAEESYICPHCGESLQSWMDFEAHQQLHKQSETTNNPRVSQGSQFPKAVQRQAQNPSQQTPGYAENKAQSQTFLPSKSVQPITVPEPLTCPRCKKIFSFHSSLSKHLQICFAGNSMSQKKYPCTRCGATFLNPLKLKFHVQNNTCKPAFKPIQCPVCVRWFSCLDGLKRHLVSHSKQVVCQICDQHFPTSEALEEHKRSSHGLNNIVRPIENMPIEKSPQTKATATVVQNSTTTPFQCQVCHRYYPKLQSLKDHLRKVHRPKNQKLPIPVATDHLRPCPFPCQICGRSYPTIKALKNHRRRVHKILGAVFPPSRGAEQMGQRQYRCQICSTSYTDMQSLQTHKRKIHGTVGALEAFQGIVHHHLYKCHICQRSYPDELSIKNHRRRVHRILGPVPDTWRLPLPTATDDFVDEIEEKPIPFL